MFLVQEAVDDGLTFAEVLQDIPHDAGAIVVYVLILTFIGFIWYGSRRTSGAHASGEPHHDEQH